MRIKCWIAAVLFMLSLCSVCFAQEKVAALNDDIRGVEAFMEAFNQKAELYGRPVRLVSTGFIGGDAKQAYYSVKDNAKHWHMPLSVGTFGDDPRIKRLQLTIHIKGPYDGADKEQELLGEFSLCFDTLLLSLTALGVPLDDARAHLQAVIMRSVDIPVHNLHQGQPAREEFLHDGKRFVILVDHLTSESLRGAYHPFLSVDINAYER